MLQVQRIIATSNPFLLDVQTALPEGQYQCADERWKCRSYDLALQIFGQHELPIRSPEKFARLENTPYS
jgi:hypothetical protein